MIVCTEAQIRKYVQQNADVVKTVEEGSARLFEGQVSMPPIMRIDFPEHSGEIDVKSAYVHGMDHFAVKMSTGFFENDKLGLPSGNGMMILFNVKTGVPKAVLLDNGYLTHLRTAAAGAVAADYLANKTVETVGMIGTGAQARYQLEALQLVRRFSKLLLYGRHKSNLFRYIEDIRAFYHGEIQVCDTAEAVVRESKLVISTTPAESPIIQAEWLHPGLHVTAIGADAEYKNELDPLAFKKADRIICDSIVQCNRLGELHHAYAANILDEQSTVLELGALTAGRIGARQREEEITICDLTGTGVQDTVVANYAYSALVKNGAGTTF
ncbi:cyclodeaminase [Virgibacillus senegalensis]|uniref:cyclodeaminase n=1 Tax=Virgibacillus senegalensis TaxID=1499679 RepID=UPI00069F16FE|nr:cyclodeaminase [Virgibacillus senegalensis]